MDLPRRAASQIGSTPKIVYSERIGVHAGLVRDPDANPEHPGVQVTIGSQHETPAGGGHRAGRHDRPPGIRATGERLDLLQLGPADAGIENQHPRRHRRQHRPRHAAAHHPSHRTTGDTPTARISRIDIAGDPSRISEWVGTPVSHLLDDIEVVWVDADDPGVAAVHIECVHGTVVLD
jgi:hypothetical protein